MLPYGKNISFLLVFLILRLSLYSQSNSPYEVRGADFFEHKISQGCHHLSQPILHDISIYSVLYHLCSKTVRISNL